MTDSNPDTPHPPQRESNSSRACELCRTLKTRCVMDSALSTSECCRCRRLGRGCVFTELTRKRRRKRTDARVAELERQVGAMEDLLKRRGVSAAPSADNIVSGPSLSPGIGSRQLGDGFTSDWDPSTTDQPVEQQVSLGGTLGGMERGRGTRLSPQSDRASNSSTSTIANLEPSPEQCPDVIDRGLISANKAAELLAKYVAILAPQFPAVMLPKGVIVNDIRRPKPALFLAMLAAASCNEGPDLHRILNAEIMKIYNERWLAEHEKPLELIQSLLITVTWSYAPDRFEELRYFRLMHMAGTLAQEVGLTLERVPPINEDSPETNAENGLIPVDSGSPECRRTVLACYYGCAGVSLCNGRPNMLQYTSWIDESAKFFETSHHPVHSDGMLLGLVRSQRITEEFTDMLGPAPDLSEARVQCALRTYEIQIEDWWNKVDPNCKNVYLTLTHHMNKLTLHKIVLYDDHEIKDFIPPFLLKSTTKASLQRGGLTSAHIDSVTSCITSAHAILETILSLAVEEIRTMPTVNYARMTFAIVVLVKLHTSATSPISRYSGIIDWSTLRTADYMELIVERLSLAAADDACRTAKKLLWVWMNIRRWFDGLTNRYQTDGLVEDLIRPLTYLGIQSEDGARKPKRAQVSLESEDTAVPVIKANGTTKKANMRRTQTSGATPNGFPMPAVTDMTHGYSTTLQMPQTLDVLGSNLLDTPGTSDAFNPSPTDTLWYSSFGAAGGQSDFFDVGYPAMVPEESYHDNTRPSPGIDAWVRNGDGSHTDIPMNGFGWSAYVPNGG